MHRPDEHQAVNVLSRRDDTPQLDLLAFAHRSDEQGGAAGFEMRQLEMDLGKAVAIRSGMKDHRSETGPQDLYHYLGLGDDLPLGAAANHDHDRPAIAAFEFSFAQKLDAEFGIGRPLLAR